MLTMPAGLISVTTRLMEESEHRRHGRRAPYTAIGIERIPCFRCGEPAHQQWQVCADGNLYRPLCVKCDIELNVTVLLWMRHPDAERLIAEYREKMLNG